MNSNQDKMEEARLAREREIEMMMVARSQAIEEEEEERAMLENERRSVLPIFIGKESSVAIVLGNSPYFGYNNMFSFKVYFAKTEPNALFDLYLYTEQVTQYVLGVD